MPAPDTDRDQITLPAWITSTSAPPWAVPSASKNVQLIGMVGVPITAPAAGVWIVAIGRVPVWNTADVDQGENVACWPRVPTCHSTLTPRGHVPAGNTWFDVVAPVIVLHPAAPIR